MSATMRVLTRISLALSIGLLAAGCGESTTSSPAGKDIGGLPDAGAPDTDEPVDDAGTELPDTGTEPADTDTPDDAGPTDISEDAGPHDAGPEDTITPPVGNTLVLNEIMYDPKKSKDDFGEWVEVYNPTNAEVDLDGWTLKDKGSNVHVISGSVPVAPGGYALLARDGSSSQNGGITPDYVYTDFFLANGGDSVQLVDPAGKTVDTLSYQVEGAWPLATPGVSIELKDPGLDNSAGGSWELAVVPFGDGDLGTPGAPNGKPEAAFSIAEEIGDWQQPGLKASLRFSPHDDLQDYILGELAQAKSLVRMAYFNIRLPAVMWVLEALIEDGVTVEVLLDKKQQDLEYNTMGEDMIKAGIPVTLIDKTSAEQATMHHKVIIIDEERVIMGSPNLSSTALNKSDEDLLIIDSASIASRFLKELDEIKADGKEKETPYPADAKLRLWMGPEDDLDGKVLSLLDGAKDTVLVAMFQLNQKGLIDALIETHNKGVKVLVFLDGKFKAEGDAEVTLADAGIDVFLAINKSGEYAEMHSKLLVVDHQHVAMGSYNWTNLASFHNDESLVVIDDAVLAYRAAGRVAELIDTYSPKSASELGLVTGPQPVTFKVHNITLDEGATLFIKSIGSGPFQTATAFDGTTLKTTLKAGSRLEYRYQVKSKDGAILGEGGLKHFYTVPYAAGPFEVHDVFLP